MADLTRHEQPLPTFRGLQREMNRLFDEAFGGSSEPATHSWVPPVEIYDTESELVIMAELPGFRQDEINISFENGVLTLGGERRFDEGENRNYHRNERRYGRFERSFHLPATVNPDEVEANLCNGLLKIAMPKKEEAKARQIPVSAG